VNHDLCVVVATYRHDLQEVPGSIRAEVENFARVVLVSGDKCMLDAVANVLVADPCLRADSYSSTRSHAQYRIAKLVRRSAIGHCR
jgi:hypothetical protein